MERGSAGPAITPRGMAGRVEVGTLVRAAEGQSCRGTVLLSGRFSGCGMGAAQLQSAPPSRPLVGISLVVSFVPGGYWPAYRSPFLSTPGAVRAALTRALSCSCAPVTGLSAPHTTKPPGAA